MAKMVCSFLTPLLLERPRDLAGLTFILAQDNSSSIRPFNGKRLVTLSKISLEGEQLFHWWQSNSPIHWPRINENHLPVATAGLPQPQNSSSGSITLGGGSSPFESSGTSSSITSNTSSSSSPSNSRQSGRFPTTHHNSLTATAFPSPPSAAVALLTPTVAAAPATSD